MRITTVKATLRYSAEAKGAWRSIEVGAEATLTASDEDWREAQAQLYAELGQQLKALWNGKAEEVGARASTHETGPTDNGTGTEKAPVQQAPRGHWCNEHNQEWKKRTGPHGEFYSHKIQGTNSWCNEKK